jgi:catechol 2,3-dioxygenase-like lactoylglutathione lyase family enzyme
MPTPIIGLDHLQVYVPSLAAARDNYSQLFGFPPLWQGLIGEIETAVFRTLNGLYPLNGGYTGFH